MDVVKIEASSFLPRAEPTTVMIPGPGLFADSVFEKEHPYRVSKSTAHSMLCTHNADISRRVIIEGSSVDIHGWPSRGGRIILENATGPDFDFLHLDALDPPLRRDANQDAEDAFCQRLLRLGAIWWDSVERHRFVLRLGCEFDEVLDEQEDQSFRPSSRERAWVKVAWPSEPAGSFCVLERKIPVYGRKAGDTKQPRYHGIVSLARTMDERFALLKRLGGVVYGSIEEYQGDTFLRAWEDGHKGEKGPLRKARYNDPAKYGGEPHEALGLFQKKEAEC